MHDDHDNLGLPPQKASGKGCTEQPSLPKSGKSADVVSGQ